MKKKILSFCILFALLINLLPLSGCGNKEDYGSADSVTRGEWITMLAEAFGMESYIEEAPYYADVPSSSALFPYVQSSSEWGVLSIYPNANLEPDEKLTREELGCTAAIAAGFAVTDEQFDSDGVFDSDYSIAYAIQYGILASDSNLSKHATLDECETAVSAAQNAYLSAPITEKNTVSVNKDLIDLTDLDVDENTIEDGNFIVLRGVPSSVVQGGTERAKVSIDTGAGVVEIGVGEVFITAPSKEKPDGIAYKVAAIEEINGEVVITTEEPTLYDLYDEIDVSTTVSADSDDIIWMTESDNSSKVQGVVSQDEDTFRVEFLSALVSVPRAASLSGKTYSYGGYSNHFEIGNGSIESDWSNHSSSVIGSSAGAQALSKSNFVYDGVPSIEDFNGTTDSWSKNLEIDNSFYGGYKITGDISINAITVTTSVDYKKTKWLGIPYGVENASIQVNSDISSTLTLEGNLSERVHIATVPIPIAATGLSVCVDIYLYADANGSLVVSAALGNSAKVEYAEGKLKHAASSQANASVDANIEINFGAELAATLEACGIVKIMDVGAKAGGVLSANASVSGFCKASEENGVTKLTYQESLKIVSDLYVPTVNLYVGGSGTLVNKIGLSGSWDIITKENAAHYTLADYEWVFWEETVLIDENGEITASKTETSGEKDGIGASNERFLDLKTYVLTIKGEPKRLELDLDEGESAPNVVWTSANTSIATVDSTGMVSPVSTGYTTVTVSLVSDPSVYVKCAVYVEEIGESNWEFLPSDLSFVTDVPYVM